MEKKIQTTKFIGISLLLLILSINLFYLGGCLNDTVMEFNGGKMPVKTFNYFESDRHFAYINNHEVSFWMLSDILPMGGWIYSIGDIMIYISFISLFCTLSISNIFLIKEIYKISKK